MTDEKYIRIRIRELLYYYILCDLIGNKFDKETRDIAVHNYERQKEIEENTYKEFIRHLEMEYETKIEDISKFREDFIEYQIETNDILCDIIEDEL
jgi:hypothetical protein